VEKLHLMSPYDELTELRSVMTVPEIAEMTGVRRETLSRARPDSRLQRRTQRALDDLYAVVIRLRRTMGGDPVHLAAVMRRPQSALAQRSIADLLQEGKVDEILDHLTPAPAPTAGGQLENLRLDPEVLAGLSETTDPTPDQMKAKAAEDEQRVEALLEAVPELASRLPAIESRIRGYFGADSRIERRVPVFYDSPEDNETLYLRIRSSLDHDEQIDRLTRLLGDEDDLLDPVAARLTIGML
jgi:hypothetical protein